MADPDPHELDAIPNELRERAQWVLYRAQTRNGKTTKVPYQTARATRRASSTDPATWGSFDSALDARRRGAGDGVGFVFTPDDPYAGVDLDACVHGNVIEQHAQQIIEQLDSYTELSPSGTGLHVITRAQVGGGRRTGKTPWGGEFEVYDRGRYFTMTGQRVNGAPAVITDRDKQLAALRAALLPDDPVLPSYFNGNALAGRLDDDRELLDRAFAARNGAKFQALWQGDTSGYKSASEADCALCGMLAFWTGPDEQRIDWLFRQSALVRDKWDREQYRKDTIGKALAGRTEFYSPPAPLPPVTNAATALTVASTAIRMDAIPLVAARESRGGRLVLERADGLRMAAPSLASLATFATLAGGVASAFGHELVVAKDEKTATAHRFVAALRWHLGPEQVTALEERFEGWMIELALVAGEVPFEAGDAEGRLRAWQMLAAADPEAERGAAAFAAKILLAHDVTTGDRYLRASWAQEYVRRCGWRGGLEAAVGALEAIGLEQPNADGRVRANWRAGGETLVLRFWTIPQERIEQWRS